MKEMGELRGGAEYWGLVPPLPPLPLHIFSKKMVSNSSRKILQMGLPKPTFLGILGNQICTKCFFSSKTGFSCISGILGRSDR